MTKFTLEDKLEAVLKVLNGENSIRGVAREIGTRHCNVHEWIAFYKAYGASGLNLKCTKTSGEFKLEVLNYMSETGASFLETAVKFKIPSLSSIFRWRNTLYEQGIDALFTAKQGRPSMKKENNKKQFIDGSTEALQEENRLLKMENEYLKKLNALVQKEERSKTHIKRK